MDGQIHTYTCINSPLNETLDNKRPVPKSLIFLFLLIEISWFSIFPALSLAKWQHVLWPGWRMHAVVWPIYLGGLVSWLFKIRLYSFIAKTHLYLLLLVAAEFYKNHRTFLSLRHLLQHLICLILVNNFKIKGWNW